MALADVALNACIGGFSLGNRMAGRLLQSWSERRGANELHIETHVLEGQAVAGLAGDANLIGIRRGEVS
jgi:hypothetical protein